MKPIYDMILPKYYPIAAADLDKLNAVRASGSLAELFFVVFFAQLPNYDYPPGIWYGERCDLSRSGFPGFRGIRSQYERLRQYIPRCQDWPVQGPALHACKWTGDPNELRRWFGALFQPLGTWRFDPAVQLKDAAVAAAIWSVK